MLEPSTLLDAQVQMKRIYNQLSEVMDLSRQIAQALDRDDQVSVQLLVAMREEPVQKLCQARRALEIQRDGLPQEQGARLAALLDGAEAQTKEETPLADQVAMSRRLHRQVMDLEQILNRRIGGEKSVCP